MPRRDTEEDIRRTIFEDAEEVSAEHAPDPNGQDYEPPPDFDANAPPPPGNKARMTPSKYRFKLLGFNDIKLGTTALYLVRNIIPMQGLIVVWGPPKCGKSFWALDLLFHIALDWEYRGHRVKQGRVVYIGCEGEFAIPARIEAFRQSKLAENTEEPPFHLLLTRLGLASDVDELIIDLKAQLGTQRPTVIAIDTLNRSLEGSESSDEDMGNYVKAVDKLRAEFHCAVIIIHHCGIDGTRPRGHTALRGACDAEISVKKDNLGQVVTTVEFMKDGPDGETTVSRLKPIEVGLDDDHEIITSCIVDPNDGAPQKPAAHSTAKPKKLVGAAAVGLAQLKNCAAKYVTPPPPFDEIPKGAKGVSLELWRKHLALAGVINEDGSPREQFRRIRVTLQELGYIGVWEDFVWINP